MQRLERRFEQGGQLASHAAVAEQVGPVGRDLKLKQHIRIKELLDRSSNFRVGGKNEQAVLARGQADLRSGTKHTLRLDLAHDGFVDRESSRKLGAGKRAGNFVANLVILRAANDLAQRAFTCINLRDLQAIGIRVLNRFLDLRDDNFFRAHPLRHNAFHLNPGEGKKVVNFPDRLACKIKVGGEPVE